MTNHDTAIEAQAANERDRLRRAALEQLYVALKANIAEQGNNNVTWRKVLEAVRKVEEGEC